MMIVAAYIRWAVARVGYWIRPYDMLADRRRWWLQPRQRCGWSYAIRIRIDDEKSP
jgi:hypothetical protein